MTERLLTINEFSELLHRSKESTRRLAKKIGFIRDGKQMLIKKSDVKEYLDSRYVKGR